MFDAMRLLLDAWVVLVMTVALGFIVRGFDPRQAREWALMGAMVPAIVMAALLAFGDGLRIAEGLGGAAWMRFAGV